MSVNSVDKLLLLVDAVSSVQTLKAVWEGRQADHELCRVSLNELQAVWEGQHPALGDAPYPLLVHGARV
jgi:hypothetical protein